MVDLIYVVDRELRKRSEVAATIGFLLAGGEHTRKNMLWLKHNNRTYYATLWMEPKPTPNAQIVFHKYPLRSTHFVLEIYKTEPFKRCADFILSVEKWNGDMEYYAFVPVCNLCYVQTIDPAFYATFHILWATVDIGSLCHTAETLHLTEENMTKENL